MEVSCENNRGKGSTFIASFFSREATSYWIMLGIALGVRVVHQLIISQSDPMYGFLLRGGDNYTYSRWASEISQGVLLGWERIPFFHGPLYPYLLSLVYLRFGREHDPAAWTQRLLGAVIVVLIFYLARRIFGRKAGWIAGVGAAFSPLSLFYEGELLVETLLLFLHTGTLCLLVEGARRRTVRWWLLCGVAVGLCCIGRPNALLLVPVAACWIGAITDGSWKQRLRTTSAFVLMVIVVISPVTLLNYTVGNRFFLVTYSGGYNLYIGNAPDALGLFFTPPSMEAIREAEQKEDMDIPWRDYLLDAVRDNPGLLPAKLWMKTRMFWQSGELPCDVNFYVRQSYSPFYALPFRWAVVAPLGLIGMGLAFCIRRPKRLTDPRLILTVYLLVYAASVILVFVPGRLRMPVLAILLIFAAYALTAAWEALLEAGRSRKVQPLLYRVVPVLVLWPMLGFALRSPEDAMLVRWNDHFNMGSAYELQDDYGAALEEYEKAYSIAPQLEWLQDICEDLRERKERRDRALGSPL